MKKLIAVALVGVVLFSASAGVSWYLKQEQEKIAESAEVPAGVTLKPGKEIRPFAAPTPEAKPGGTAPRPAIRPPHNPQAEGVAQMASNLRNQTEAVQNRERQLAIRQKNMDVIYQDLSKERQTITDLQKQVNEEMKALMNKLASLEQKATEVDQQHSKMVEKVQEIKKNISEFDNVEQNRIKQMAAIYDTMEPESAAEILMHMVDSGKLDTAVKILATMRERQAARILSQVQDRTVAVELLDRLKGLKKATPTTQ